MPITNTTVETSEQANGGKNVIERHFYNDTEVASYQWFAEAGMDVQAVVNARIPQINEQLAQAEYERIVGAY